MNVAQAVLTFMGLLLAALLIEPLARRLRVPVGLALVAAGYLGATALTTHGFDTGLRWDTFQPLIAYVFIPALVFHAALELDPRGLWRDIVPIAMLAVPAVALATGLIAVMVYFAIGHPDGFPWIAAWLAGVLLASTDPGAAIAWLRERSGSERVALLIESESLFNDALSIVLFSTLLPLALMSGMEAVTWTAVAAGTALAFIGGIVIGVASGLFACVLLHGLQGATRHALVTWTMAYLSYVIADSLAQCSGVMAVLACGLVLGEWGRRHRDSAEHPLAREWWSCIAYAANRLLFLLAGVTVTASMFTEQWLAMLIGIVAVTASRLLSVVGGLSVLRAIPALPVVTLREQLQVAAGGTRGVVTLALALSLPLQLDYWFTLQSMAYGVVLFTLSAQMLLFALTLRPPRPR